MDKRGIAGPALIYIAIAAFLASFWAAKTILFSGGELGQKAIRTEQLTREKVTTMVNIVSIEAIATNNLELIQGFQMSIRLAPGSENIDLNNFVINFITANNSYSATYQSNISFNSSTVHSVHKEDRFSVERIDCNDNDLLEEGELVNFIWYLASDFLITDTDFEVQFISAKGPVVVRKFKTPYLIERKLTRVDV